MSVVALRDVRKAFGPIEIAKGIDSNVNAGEFVVFCPALRVREVDAASHRLRPGGDQRRTPWAACESGAFDLRKGRAS